MIAKGRGKIRPLALGHLFTEGHPRKLLLQPLAFRGTSGRCEPVRYGDESPLLRISGFQTAFDEVNQHTVRTRLLDPGERDYTPGDSRRQRDVLSDHSFACCHAINFTPGCATGTLKTSAVDGLQPGAWTYPEHEGAAPKTKPPDDADCRNRRRVEVMLNVDYLAPTSVTRMAF